jgi:ubiquinone biosynthesis protein
MSLLAVPDLQFRRYRQIAEVLTRHGLRWLRDASGLERFRHFRSDLSEVAKAESLTTAERVWLALEELGATFIKLGQFLSTRADLLPPEYQTALAKLQDSAPAFDSETAIERNPRTHGRAPIEAAHDDAPSFNFRAYVTETFATNRRRKCSPRADAQFSARFIQP